MSTHYRLQYRLVGHGSSDNERLHTRDLTVGYDKYRLACDDDQAMESLHHFMNRPWLDVEVKPTRITKVVTTLEYEDVTNLLPPERTS